MLESVHGPKCLEKFRFRKTNNKRLEQKDLEFINTLYP